MRTRGRRLLAWPDAVRGVGRGRTRSPAGNAAQTARRIGREQPSLAALPARSARRADRRASTPVWSPTRATAPSSRSCRPCSRSCAATLDAEDRGPPRRRGESARCFEASHAARSSRIFALAGTGVLAAALAGPGGLPGPGPDRRPAPDPGHLFVVRNPASALLPALAIPAGAIGALLVVPALIALAVTYRPRTPRPRRKRLRRLPERRHRLRLRSSALGIAARRPRRLGALGSRAALERARGAPVDPGRAARHRDLRASPATVLGRLLESSLPVACWARLRWAAALETVLGALGDGGLGERPGPGPGSGRRRP